jgi:hypothetical protein
LCAVAIFAAGCHGNPNDSDYGIAWVTVTDQPGDFSSYIVTIDGVTLTRNDGIVVSAASAAEIVDFTQVSNIAEMWGSTAIPNGTYLSATITLDYTSVASGGSSQITVLVDGVPTIATVLDATTGLAPTTYSVTVTFDPNNPLVITPTYASTSAQRLAIEMNLAASGWVSISGGSPTLYVKPFLTAGVQAADNKLIRVRGPLINSSTDVQTYTVYIRPFYDEANNIGTLTLFNQPNTIYTINGKTLVGAKGLDALSVLSAGTTMTAGYTTFEPTVNPANAAAAGKFNLVYVVGASTLEDEYTEGISGDVVARTGNTVTLLASTLFLNTADTFDFCVTGSTTCTGKTQVLLGAGTIVTADDNSTLTELNSDAIAVGQHITVRGNYSILADGTTQIDATSVSSTNTGSVRLQSTEVWGPLVSSAAGSLVMNVQTIHNLPVSDFTFTGNGASALNPAAFTVETGALALPAGTAAGDPVWADGYFSPFGSAPPDFTAVALNNELSVQTAGGPVGGGAPTVPGILTCGIGSQVCEPASLQVVWDDPGTLAAFSSLSDAGFTVDLTSSHIYSAVIRIGPESIDLTSLPASPQVVPTTLPVTSTFAPQFTVGNPTSSSTTETVLTATTTLRVYNTFAGFVAQYRATLDEDNLVRQLEVHGVYNRATNILTATSVNLVL